MQNQNYLKINTNKILDFIFNLYAICIAFEIKLRNFNKNKNLYYFGYFGWADNFCFYMSEYRKIKLINNNFALVWNSQNYEICKFLFPKKKIIKLFFFIPKFIPSEKIEKFLSQKKGFNPIILKNKLMEQDYLVHNKDSYRNLLNYFLKFKLEKKSINKIMIKNYVCFYFRFFPEGTKIVRSSSEIHKCYSIIKFLIKNNFNVVLLGKKTEKYLKFVKNEFHREVQEKKIYFISDLILDMNFADQLNLMKNSKFYCGTQSGFIAMYYFLKKNALSFDGFYLKEHSNPGFNNIKFLYKKIIINNEKTELKNEIFKEDYEFKKIVDNSYEEITDNIKKFF